MTDPDHQRPFLVGPAVAEQPKWARRHLEANGWQSLRAFPATVAATVGLVWRSSRRLTLLTVLTQAGSGVTTTFGLLATSNVFNRLLLGGPTPTRVVAALPALAVVVLAYAARSGLAAATQAAQGALIPRVALTADLDLKREIASVDLIAFDDADFLDLLRQTGDRAIGAISTTINGVATVVSSLVSVVAALVAVGLLQPLLAPALLVVAGVDAWSARRAARLTYANFLTNAPQRRQMSILGGLLEERQQATERYAYTVTPHILREYVALSHDQLRNALRLRRRQTVISLVGQVMSSIGTAIAYVVLGLLLYSGTLALALAGTAAIAMRTASSALSGTLNTVNRVYSESFYLGFLRQLHDEAAARRRPAATHALTEPPHTIGLHGVSFTYPGQPAPALRDIDVTLHAGEIVALVGENGSGKTTLGKLITGLYLATEGTVTWNDRDVATLDAESVYSRVALIAQQPAQWPTTARTNVRIGRLEVDDPVRWHTAVDLSGAGELIDSLPKGPETVLSRDFSEGQDLSGGQWQRLAIARGIYRDADVLVADEPSAALDAKAEAKAFAGLRAATSHNGARRITILVTHRLANIRRADRILVLHEGRIVEQGTHDELMATGTRYRTLFDLQASAYADPVPTGRTVVRQRKDAAGHRHRQDRHHQVHDPQAAHVAGAVADREQDAAGDERHRDHGGDQHA
ncbi:MAG TPA: ABC transporter ATP-binding protein [Pseudonocardiaceae bacterium]|nr:ABC transporter ATP-binding protein [Pseudonocardiaceae bacterium]